jgi:hypothetical protein
MPKVAPSSSTAPVLSVVGGARLNDHGPGPKQSRKPDRPGTAERRDHRPGASAKASIGNVAAWSPTPGVVARLIDAVRSTS